MRNRFRERLFALTAVLACSSVLISQTPDRSKVVAGAERAFAKASKINTGPAPGCSVGVSLAGESVFENAFGLAEMERHRVTWHPRFH